ncbi:unnamed protein product [Priceomyces carsonii]|nr:unnamed protein product [Priceomyces carsonii]
MPEVAEVSIF